jgi:N-terminal domain of toast_rack, DUF2154
MGYHVVGTSRHVLAAGIAAAVVLSAGCSGERVTPGAMEHEHRVVDLGSAQSSTVRLKMGAGQLIVKGGAKALVEADFDYNVPSWKPSVAYQVANGQGDLEISQDVGLNMGGHTENSWRVTVNDATPVTVRVDLGAGQASLGLGSLTLQGVDVHMGAGDLDLDLRGQPTQSYHVSVHGGVGQATVHVPKTVGINATASGGLGEIHVDGLENHDGRWINAGAAASPVTIDLMVQGGVGQIHIVAE